ncbi:MAG: Zn-ribbon domain-containing OB-fold protein [Rhodospirillales bacterium]|jgi:hypothetical protein|nr:Zn-ribbon domain-containing OB-fold protein [Rhodospirillales bacterium]MBT4006388.1 Zn-ribbon domain-containing OB-fold protein [Rhodospirillales bacterium]MBT5075495.1 Zn-ribbon domain-containing OB-fold protein [Rhodospirillales bacterium]MBT5114265.1 Zn-ribbon domain-containing OB-fold protein [Rhodospirillales bacterium]MBT5673135.1 Zn-ribbon domain-containing OB-fold protein [Rhodospirillales bacterium]
MTEYTKPLPRPSTETKPFWDGAKAHQFLIQKCNDCGKFWFPPSTRCIHCLSENHGWVEVSGKGRVFSFVTYHRMYHKGWKDDLPYVVAVIELEEGPRLLSNITNCAPEDVKCDMAVKVVFDDVTEDTTLPKFSPV